ncbi:heterodisulfide reductase-related iron-sulfur binding cluster, partial [Proteus mirabilis]|uniref:heterodisulfide reductase-related iron-sulfur binding cluster n=1 Tax=Proteus mirabilis TaxID=584 RepID=UPI000F271C8B
GVLWFYQALGLQKIVHKSGLLNILPENLRTFEKVMPKITSPVSRSRRATTFSPPQAVPKLKIGFFTGCIMDAVFERINRLSMELLALAGCEVYVIQEQTCCGALHAHTGREEDTIRLAKQNIASFGQLEVDYIVNNAGGCGALLKEYQHLLHYDV